MPSTMRLSLGLDGVVGPRRLVLATLLGEVGDGELDERVVGAGLLAGAGDVERQRPGSRRRTPTRPRSPARLRRSSWPSPPTPARPGRRDAGTSRQVMASLAGLVATVRPSMATSSSTNSMPPSSQAAISSSLIGREASVMSASPAQNVAKPSPGARTFDGDGELATVSSTASSPTRMLIGSTVDEPVTKTSPPASSTAVPPDPPLGSARGSRCRPWCRCRQWCRHRPWSPATRRSCRRRRSRPHRPRCCRSLRRRHRRRHRRRGRASRRWLRRVPCGGKRCSRCRAPFVLRACRVRGAGAPDAHGRSGR